MKTMSILLVVVFSSCSPSNYTTGEWDTELQAKEPYAFLVPKNDASPKNTIKNILYANGWSIETDDDEWIITKERELAKDEDVNTNSISYAFIGEMSEFSKGTLQFHITDSLVVMKGRNWKGKFGEMELTQGHPLMMKYRRALELRGYVLTDVP